MKKLIKNMNKKDKRYYQLTQSERDRIEILLNKKHKQKDIAKVLKRSPSTISREIKRNSRKDRIKGKGFVFKAYESNHAQNRFRTRQIQSKYQWNKINKNDELREFITEELKKFQSPDTISKKMKKLNTSFYASKNCIYDWFKTGKGDTWQKYLYSGKRRIFGRKKNKKNKKKKEMIPNRVSIHQRPDIKGLYGHWEADTIVSGKKTKSKTALLVCIERKSMKLVLKKINNLKPNTFANNILEIKKDFQIKSLTLDNGIENRYHEKIGVNTFFCDPYCSGQKGKIEQVNKMIRWFIPKGSDISLFDDDYIKKVEYILNNKYRKSLGYRCPNEVIMNGGIMKKKIKKYQQNMSINILLPIKRRV